MTTRAAATPSDLRWAARAGLFSRAYRRATCRVRTGGRGGALSPAAGSCAAARPPTASTTRQARQPGGSSLRSTALVVIGCAHPTRTPVTDRGRGISTPGVIGHTYRYDRFILANPY